MNTIKRTLIMAVCAIPMLAIGADYPWLTFKMTDGTEISVAAEGLAIDYIDGILLLKSPTVDQSLPIDRLATMRFTAFAAGVEGTSEILLSEADYYDLSGKKAGRFISSDEARKSLPSGAYIVKSENRTIKVIF